MYSSSIVWSIHLLQMIPSSTTSHFALDWQNSKNLNPLPKHGRSMLICLVRLQTPKTITFRNKSWSHVDWAHVVCNYSKGHRCNSKSKIKLLHLFFLATKHLRINIQKVGTDLNLYIRGKTHYKKNLELNTVNLLWFYHEKPSSTPLSWLTQHYNWFKATAHYQQYLLWENLAPAKCQTEIANLPSFWAIINLMSSFKRFY